MSTEVMEPNVICPMRGADKVLGKLSGCVPIYLCASTCAYSLKFHRLESISADDVEAVVLEDRDVIFGNVKEKVAKAVERVVTARKPKLVVLVSTCLPEIIGLPLEGLAARLAVIHQLKVVASRTECLRYPNYRDGEDLTLATLCAHLGASDQPREASLNVVGSLRVAEEAELRAVLRKAGVRLNTTVPNHELDAFRALPRATFDVAVDDHSGRALGVLEERFGLRTIDAPVPVGLEATTRFYTAIARAFDRDGEVFQQHLTDREAAARLKVAPLLPALAGKRIALFGCTSEEVPLARSLVELGMKVVHVSTYPSAALAKDRGDTALGCEVAFTPDVSEDLEVIRRARPDLVLGSFPQMHLARTLGIPATQLFWALQRKLGYDGFAYLARYVHAALSNTIYAKVKATRDEWLAQ